MSSVKHSRTILQANKMVEESRRRRVKAAVMRHWTPVEVAAWIERVLRKAEVNDALHCPRALLFALLIVSSTTGHVIKK